MIVQFPMDQHLISPMDLIKMHSTIIEELQNGYGEEVNQWEVDEDEEPRTGFGSRSRVEGFGGSGFNRGRTNQNGDGDGNRNRSYGDGPSECFKCGQSGHFARDCTSSGGNDRDRDSGFNRGNAFGGRNESGFSGGDGRGSSNKCFKCQETGHIARDCPNEESGDNSRGGGGSGECFKCHKTGHFARECPDDTGRGGGEGDDGNKKARSVYVPDFHEDDEDRLYEHIAQGSHFDQYDKIPVSVYRGDTSDRSRYEAQCISSFSDVVQGSSLRQLDSNMQKANFKRPTPIQKYAVPLALDGQDVMGIAQTGSGKTLAYMLPIMIQLLQSGEVEGLKTPGGKQEPLVLIVAPTRELAKQICEACMMLSRETGVSAYAVYGGTAMGATLTRLRAGQTIIAATCGRLMHLIKEGTIGLSRLRYLVLDEADRMLQSDGFYNEIESLCRNPELPAKEDRTTFMFSATFPDEIQRLAHQFMKPDFAIVAVGKIGAANADVKQRVLKVEEREKRDKLMDILKEDLEKYGTNRGTLVFVERKRMCDVLATWLTGQGLKSTSMHGTGIPAAVQAVVVAGDDSPLMLTKNGSVGCKCFQILDIYGCRYGSL